MNVILFKQIREYAVVGNISEEMILCLIRAGMVVTNVQVWKTFAISRHSSNNIGTTMGSLLNTTLQSKFKKASDATQLSVGKTKQIAKKQVTDSTNEKKQSFLDIIEISSDTTVDSNKTFDSQETISKERTDTDLLENTMDAAALQHPPVFQQQKTKSVMPVIGKRKG